MTREQLHEVRMIATVACVPVSGRRQAISHGNHWVLVVYNICSDEVMVGEGMGASLSTGNMRTTAAIIRLLGQHIGMIALGGLVASRGWTSAV